MAAKKKVTRTPPGKRPNLAVPTQKELQKLLGRQKAGTITGRELETGLKEVNNNLKKLSIWIHIPCN
jgi:hypothetical protein